MSTSQKELPAGWKWVALGDIANNHDSQRIPIKASDRKNISGGFPYYGASGIIDWVEDYLFEGEYLLIGEDGANLVARSTPIAFIATGKFWINNHAHILTAREMTTNLYLENVINQMNIERFVTGAAQPKLNQKNLNRIPIPLPPIEEQKRITGILNKAEEIKKLREEADKKTEELIPAIFYEMVGSRIKNGEELPTGWQLMKLGDITTKITDGTHQSPTFTDAGIPFLFVKNIVDGTIDFHTEKYISTSTFEQLTRTWKPEQGDILYSAVGSFGVAVAVETDTPFLFQRHIAIIKPKHDLVDRQYLRFYLNSPEGKRQSDLAAIGIAQRTVSLGNLSKFTILIPSIDEQREIANRCNEAEEIKNTNSKSDKKIEELKSSLLQRAFRGEL